MSGQLSTNFFNSVELQSVANTRESKTITNKTFRRSLGGQYYVLKLKSKPLERSDADTLFAFLASQDGKFDSFTFIPPIISNTKGTASGTVTVNNAEVTETESGGVALSKSAGSRAVGITNSSETGTLKIGDKIKFSNHDKVYVLTADINLDGSTVNALQFYPPLTTAVTSSTTVTYENVPFKVSLMDDVVRETISTDGLYTIEFTVREDT